MAVHTAVDICNRALTKLGAEPINQIDDPQLINEKRLARLYPVTKRLWLKRHRWVCAKQETYLSPLEARSLLGLYRFPLPTDCLRPLRDDSTTWEAKGSEVWDGGPGPLYLEYIAEIAEAQMDDAFADVLAHALAAEMAWPVTQNRNVVQDKRTELNDALSLARRDNAFIAGDDDLSDSDAGFGWVTDRW